MEAEDPASLARAVLALRADRAELESMGTHGRAYAEEHFGRSQIVSEYHRLLGDVAGHRPTRQAT